MSMETDSPGLVTILFNPISMSPDEGAQYLDLILILDLSPGFGVSVIADGRCVVSFCAL